MLNDKADAEALTNHESDENAHSELFSGLQKAARFLVNRNNKMFFTDDLLAGDTVTGMVEGEYLNAGTYYGGNPSLLSSYVEPVVQEEAIVASVTSDDIISSEDLNLFYNNINKDENGVAYNVIRYVDQDYNYLDEINQGALPSPANPVSNRITNVKVCEFTVLDSVFFQTYFLDFRNGDSQLTFSALSLSEGLYLKPYLGLGTSDPAFQTFQTTLRLVEISNDGIYRETDLQTNFYGSYESLIRIKTKINPVN